MPVKENSENVNTRFTVEKGNELATHYDSEIRNNMGICAVLDCNKPLSPSNDEVMY